MSKTRIKITGPTIRSRAEMEALVGDIAAGKNFIATTKALMDARIIEIKEEYEKQIADAEADLLPLMESARAWSEANPAEFGKRRSIEFLHGLVGWRTGTPKLKTLRGWTWAKVVQYLSDAGFGEYLRRKLEVDKDALIAARDHLAEGVRKQMGIQIVQDETFFVEPALSKVDHTAKA